MREDSDYINYPEDINAKEGVTQFREDFKHLDPELYMEPEDEWENEMNLQPWKDEEIEVKYRAYGKPSPITEIYPLKPEDSAKFSNN